jgi:hypothetical protein
MIMVKNTSALKRRRLLLAIIILLLITTVILLNLVNKYYYKKDYLAEYNRISKPIDFGPNDNSAPYFEKAFEIIKEEPNDFRDFRKLWPTDMNEDQRQAVKQWVTSNTQAIDYLKEGILKKYYWKPRTADTLLMEMDLKDLRTFREAARLLCIQAKFMADEGQIEPALLQVADVYKMGTLLTGPRILVEQLVGIAISGLALNTAFQILEHTESSPSILENFQQRVSSLYSKQTFLINVAAERLLFYDALENIYEGYGQDKSNINIKKIYMKTIGIPWVFWERHKANIMYDYFAAAAHKTPGQLHSEGNDVSSISKKMVRGTLLVRILTPAIERVILISYRPQVQTEALTAVTSLLRYKDNTGQYPNDLQELVAAGYLDKLSIDPFSGGPLTYKLSGDNFELYSFAEDLDDDGGKHNPDWAREGDGDYVFWPVQKIETSDRTKKQN